MCASSKITSGFRVATAPFRPLIWTNWVDVERSERTNRGFGNLGLRGRNEARAHLIYGALHASSPLDDIVRFASAYFFKRGACVGSDQ